MHSPVSRRAFACALLTLPTLVVASSVPASAASPALLISTMGDVAGGVAPRLEVYLNGERLSALDIASRSWTDVSIPLPRTLAPGDGIDLLFANDDIVNGRDRNLYIRHVAYGATRVPVSPRAFKYDRGTGYADATDGLDVQDGQADMYWSGALRFRVPGAAAPPARSVPASDFSGRLPDGTSSKVFAPTSFWYRELPANAPLDPHSSGIVAKLNRTARSQYASDPWPHPDYLPTATPSVVLARKSYTPGVFVSRDSDPVATFTWDNCTGISDAAAGRALVATQLQGIRVPPGAVNADGTDSEMTIYNPDTGQLTDLWVTTKHSATHFSACWGGTIPSAGQSAGVFAGGYGATATGLPFLGGLILPSELETGVINHVVGVALPANVINGGVSSPARRSDGSALGWDTLSQGQFLRLPADLDIDSLKLGRTARIIAKAAQRYGLVVWDNGGSMTFRAANVNSLGGNPYVGLFDDDDYVLMGNRHKGENAFPVDRLQVVQKDYVKP